jgi:hypothetical protein
VRYLALLLPILVVIALLPPLFRPGRDTAAEREERLDSLRERKRLVLAAIRELDFDHATGKLSDADHAAERERLKKEAAALLEEIDRREAKRSA